MTLDRKIGELNGGCCSTICVNLEIGFCAKLACDLTWRNVLSENFGPSVRCFFKIIDNFLMVCTYPTCAASQSRRIDHNRMVRFFPNINTFPVHPR
jgi:hypothetical protein